MITRSSTLEIFVETPLQIIRMINYQIALLNRINNSMAPAEQLSSALDLPIFFNWTDAPEDALDIRFTHEFGGVFVFTDGHRVISSPIGYESTPGKIESIEGLLVVATNPKHCPLPKWVLSNQKG